LKVSLDIIKKRITGRMVCSVCGNTYNEFFNPPKADTVCCKGKNLTKRTDDNVEVAVKRYETYEKSTEPVINFYEKLKLVKEINGEDKIESIYSKIDQFLSVIEG
jgi:adenylate kinase